MPRPTIIDIARIAGLSHATVSRALRPDSNARVSPATRKKVQQIAKEIGYRPSYAGRALVAGRSRIISYMSSDGFSPFYAAVARHVAIQAARRGYSVVLDCTYDISQGLPPPDPAHAEFLYSGVDGVIACDIARRQDTYAEGVRDLNVPMVGFGIHFPEGVDSVTIDLYVPTTQLIKHLVDQGCRRIAQFIDPRSREVGDPRVRGYVDGLRKSNLDPIWIDLSKHRRADARRCITEYLADHELPEAIVCVNDEAAIGCCRGLGDLGYQIPSDVAVSGCDGIEETAYYNCPITTLAQPVEAMCVAAWDILERRMAGSSEPILQVSMPAKLVVRESTLRLAHSSCSAEI